MSAIMTSTEQLPVENLFAGLEDDRESASPYLSIFIDEAMTTLDELVEALLALETGGGHKSIEQLFCAAHRMKGSAASIGLNRIAKLSHLMEDLMQAIVDKGCSPTPQIADALLACTDGLRQSVGVLGSGEAANDQFPKLARELLAARATIDGEMSAATPQSAAETAKTQPSSTGESSTIQSVNNLDKSSAVAPPDGLADLRARMLVALHDIHRDDLLIGNILFEPNLPLVGLKAQLIHSKLMNFGDLRHISPPAEQFENLETIDEMEFCIATDKSPETVRSMLKVAGVRTMAVEPLERRRQNEAADVSVETGVKSGEHAVKPAETLRVDIERLDELMNLAGQLAIGKARIAQIADKLKRAVADKAYLTARDGVGDLLETIHLLGRVSDGIQQGVMNMRMLPIGPLFSRFHRVIRDLTHANGKDIHLEISGEGTELDKRMIDELGDPMIHVIRNAADHGIESPDAREAAGKPRHGTISLSAFHRGSNIIIRVSDDGRGLDTARIRQKAIDRGLVSAADAERMTPREIHQFIWLPGLSTAEKVTEVSGRGVGMDIVRSKIEEINGSVDVESEPGVGTTFTIKLPLTLAILPSLMVEIDGDVFAVPLESVAEIVCIGRREVNTVQGRRMASVRDRVVSILTLDTVFSWRQAAKENSERDADALTLVIIGEGNQQLGLAVNRVLGEEDVVIKSIADNYRNVAGIAGASILGDGRISLILDPHALIETSSRSGIAAANTVEKPQ